jgi:TDG/mug DNA glycosylase family protein
MTKQIHPLAPIYDNQSKILILGSFPSVKSRASMFYYAHPQNRFWKLLPLIFQYSHPLLTDEDKVQLLLTHNIALWDVLHSCSITGSSDSSIRDAEPNNLKALIDTSSIKKIICNGAAAYKLFMRFQKDLLLDSGIQVIQLPSTSPANASFTFDKLLEVWKEALLQEV